MAGIPFAAIGAGLGLAAEAIQRQRAQQIALQDQMLRRRLQDAQLEDLAAKRRDEAALSTLGPGISAAPRGIGLPVATVGAAPIFTPPSPYMSPARSGFPSSTMGAAGEYGVGQSSDPAALLTGRMTALGVPQAAAEGAVRYMDKNESNLDPNAVNPTSGALGVAQWLGPRKAALTGRYGQRPDLMQQAEFMGQELETGADAGGTLEALRAARTGSEGYDIWGRQFERPGEAALAKAGVGRYGTRPPGETQVAQAGGGTVTDAGPQGAALPSEPAPILKPETYAESVAVVDQAIGGQAVSPKVRAALVKLRQEAVKDALAQELKLSNEQRQRRREDRADASADRTERMAGIGEPFNAQITAPDGTVTTGMVIHKKGQGGFVDANTGEKITGKVERTSTAAESASGARERDVAAEIKRRDDEFAAQNPNATQAEKQKEHFENRKAAEVALATATTKMARSPQAIVMRKYMEENPNATAADLMDKAGEITASQSIERAFGGGVQGRNVTSLNTAAGHIERLRVYSDALRSGDKTLLDYPAVNVVVQELARQRGLPEVTSFEVARDITADEIVRLLTSTGGTESDRRGMQSRLAAAMSELQRTGSLDVLEQFTTERLVALEQSYAKNDPKRRKMFEDEMLVPAGKRLYRKWGEHAPGAAPAATATAPPEAITILKSDPSPKRREQFESHFGPGSAARALGE